MNVETASYEIGVIAARISTARVLTNSPHHTATFDGVDECLIRLIDSLGGLFDHDSFIDGFANETQQELGEKARTEAKTVLAALQSEDE